jgi:hypothetical protein
MTISPARARANQRNAQHSTGPRTPKGKARASKNARQHGLLSRDVVLPDESVADFEAFRLGLLGALMPVGKLEGMLAERVVGCAWRLHRLGLIEAGLFVHRHHEEHAAIARHDAGACVRDPLDGVREAFVEVLDREALVTAEGRRREAERAVHEDPLARLGGLFARESVARDSFSKLVRYEASIERSLYRALHELQRLQAARAGQAVAPPVAVDVEVSGPLPEPAS